MMNGESDGAVESLEIEPVGTWKRGKVRIPETSKCTPFGRLKKRFHGVIVSYEVNLGSRETR